MCFPKQRGVDVARPLSLLRRERGGARRPTRQAAAWACAALALLGPPAAGAGALKPDPPATPASTGLQPDAFPPSSAPAPETRAPTSAVVPVPKQGGSGLGSSLQQPAVQRVPTTPSATTPPVSLPPVARPVVTVTTPETGTRASERRAVGRHAIEERRHATPRVRLPALAHGSSRMAVGLRFPAAAPLPVPGTRRDLLPAALALLALVVTSGCFLAVAARHRQEGLGG